MRSLAERYGKGYQDFNKLLEIDLPDVTEELTEYAKSAILRHCKGPEPNIQAHVVSLLQNDNQFIKFFVIYLYTTKIYGMLSVVNEKHQYDVCNVKNQKIVNCVAKCSDHIFKIIQHVFDYYNDQNKTQYVPFEDLINLWRQEQTLYTCRVVDDVITVSITDDEYRDPAETVKDIVLIKYCCDESRRLLCHIEKTSNAL